VEHIHPIDNVPYMVYIYTMAIRKPTAKGAPRIVKKVVFYLPADLMKQFKLHSVSRDISMSKLVQRLVEEELKKGGKN
jgi:hypothetical protein